MIYSELTSEIINHADLSLTEQPLLSFNIEQLIDQHRRLTLEYNMLIGYLANESVSMSIEALKHLQDIRRLAIVLALLNAKYIAHPESAVRFIKDEMVIREVLSHAKIELTDPWYVANNHLENKPLSLSIRQEHPFWNFFRLVILRSKRVLHNLRPFLIEMKFYAATLDPIDEIANPILAQIAWLFFAPRLLVNLYFLLNRLIPALGMTPEEKSVPWRLRLKNAWIDLWFEILNDSVWLLNGLLSCFFFVGPLMSLGILISTSLYWYDVLLSGIRIYTDLHDLYELQEVYQLNDVPAQLIERLNKQINYEERRLAISLAINIGLAVAVLFALPAFVLMSPMYPLLASASLLAMTFIAFGANKINDTTKPVNYSGALKNHGLFKIPPSLPPISTSLNDESYATLASNPENKLYSETI